MNNFFVPQQTAHKLLDLSVHLRELGHLQCVVNQPLKCSINGEEANQKVCLGGWVCVCVEGVGGGRCGCGIYMCTYVYI